MNGTKAKNNGKRFGLVAVAMFLMTRGQTMISNGEAEIGAAMVTAAGVLLLAYEVVNELEFNRD